MKSSILRECVQHEIALLGVPEMYRAKLAFMAGFRFALEATAREVIANRDRWPEGHKLHGEAKATLDAIKYAGTELHLDMRQAFGEPAAERFMRAMDRVGDFKIDLASTTKPRTEKQVTPNEPDKKLESMSVAERFMRAMDRVGIKIDLASAAKPRTEKQMSPSELDKKLESISVANTEGQQPAAERASPDKAECGCFECALRRFFVAMGTPARSDKAAS